MHGKGAVPVLTDVNCPSPLSIVRLLIDYTVMISLDFTSIRASMSLIYLSVNFCRLSSSCLISSSETMEIIHYDELVQVSKEITLKALDKGLITVSDDYKETARNIAGFYNEISNALSEPPEAE